MMRWQGLTSSILVTREVQQSGGAEELTRLQIGDRMSEESKEFLDPENYPETEPVPPGYEPPTNTTNFENLDGEEEGL